MAAPGRGGQEGDVAIKHAVISRLLPPPRVAPTPSTNAATRIRQAAGRISYTTVTVLAAEARLLPDEEALDVSATVENTGARRGGHVVQVYASRTGEGAATGRRLIGFARVDLPPDAEVGGAADPAAAAGRPAR